MFAFLSCYVFLLADIKNSNDTKVIFNYDWTELNTLLVILGILLGLTSIAFTAWEKRNKLSYNSIKQDLDNTKHKLSNVKDEYYSLCCDNIKFIFEKFFEQSGGNGRISIYKHKNSSFTLIGRYSNNPIYKIQGRGVYPDNEGFIAIAWERGEFAIHSAPSWSGKSGTEYRNFMKNSCAISDEVLKKLTMKSRSFFIYRFDSENSDNPYGIIVFEKLESSEIDKDAIKEIFKVHGKQIVSLIKSIKSI